MFYNTLLLAFRAIRRNMLRSFLTMLGIIIGVAAVIIMVTLGNGATAKVSQEISSLGTNLLIIRPGQRMGPRSDSGAKLFSIADVETVRRDVMSIEAAAPIASRMVTVVSANNNWSTQVIGSDNDYFITGNWSLAAGRLFNEAEMESGQSRCVIGQTLVKSLALANDPIGQKIRLRNFNCEVIGLLDIKGQSSMGQDQDDIMVMPIKTFHRRLAGNQDVSLIRVSVVAGANSAVVNESIRSLLRERRHLTPAQIDDFNIMDTRQLTDTLTGTTRVLTMLLGAVSAVSLIVGGIGIMNIMLVSVTERTREIGIRMAIGALAREVMLQFLVEAVVLSCLGGLLGIFLAIGVSYFLSDLMGVPYIFNAQIIVLAFGFSALIGIVFGYFPARNAALLNPIEALRHE